MPTSNTLLLGTRKGLLILEPAADSWRVARHTHCGTPVSYAALDPRTNTLWACLDHGHWGQKLERSTDGGESWTEVTAPKYPEWATKMVGYPGTEGRKEEPAT